MPDQENKFEELKEIYRTKFGTSDPAPEVICKLCGVAQAKHFGYICPTKEQLKHIQTPEEEMENQRKGLDPIKPKEKKETPFKLKAFFYILINDFLTPAELHGIVSDAHPDNHTLFFHKSIEKMAEDTIQDLLED